MGTGAVVFNSLTFLIFFAVVLSLHYLPLRLADRRSSTSSSPAISFTRPGIPPFVLLLILAAVVDFWLAQWMGRIENRPVATMLLAIGLT